MHVKPSNPRHVRNPLHCLRYTFFNYLGVCCCLQTYNLNFKLERMGLVLGQSWMVVPINRRILLCPPIILYGEVCCCLHIHSVVKVLVMGLGKV